MGARVQMVQQGLRGWTSQCKYCLPVPGVGPLPGALRTPPEHTKWIGLSRAVSSEHWCCHVLLISYAHIPSAACWVEIRIGGALDGNLQYSKVLKLGRL